VDELRWILTHLDAQAPTLVIQEIFAKLIEVQAQTREPLTASLEILWM